MNSTPVGNISCPITCAINTYEGRLVRYVHSLCGDIHVAAEIVQESFLKLCRLPEVPVDSHLSCWLFRVARNLAIDHLRKEKRMRTTDAETLDRLVSRVATDSPQVKSMQASETMDGVQRGIGDLPEAQQEVVRLRFENQLSYKQIAEITGQTSSNVGFLLHHAIKRLRGKLQPG